MRPPGPQNTMGLCIKTIQLSGQLGRSSPRTSEQAKNHSVRHVFAQHLNISGLAPTTTVDSPTPPEVAWISNLDLHAMYSAAMFATKHISSLPLRSCGTHSDPYQTKYVEPADFLPKK